MRTTLNRSFLFIALFALAACSSKDAEAPAEEETTGEEVLEPARVPPPAPGEPRELHFPETSSRTLDNGLQILTAPSESLPIAYSELVFRSGDAHSPSDRAGLATLTAKMLELGTKKKSQAELAEAVEFLGASLHISSDADSVRIRIRSLSEHLPEVLALLDEIAFDPAFSQAELDKLKRRELDRLSLNLANADYLSRMHFYAALYGDHPYAALDTNEAVIQAIKRADLMGFHRANFTPDNALLLVAGDFDEAALATAIDGSFGKRSAKAAGRAALEAPKPLEGARIVLVDRPESVQSTIRIGNLALPRSSADFIALEVANEVLGGSASSRLFMDLREKRSLTYGAYSGVAKRAKAGPFAAMTRVRNEVTFEAIDAIFEHLNRIVSEAPSEAELSDAKNGLILSFPRSIDSLGKIVDLLAERELYGLEADYWDGYRESIAAIGQEDALTAAHSYIRPQDALVVVVGQASLLAEGLRRYGPVTIVDAKGALLNKLPAAESD